MVSPIFAIFSFFSRISSSAEPKLSFISSASSLSLDISLNTRLMFSSAKVSCCEKLASSICLFSASACLAASSALFCSIFALSELILSVSSLSCLSDSARAILHASISALICRTETSISSDSLLLLVYALFNSSCFLSAASRFIEEVFSASCFSCSSVLSCSSSFLTTLSFSLALESSVSRLLSFFSLPAKDVSSSSISLLRPKRLLLFLNAPPDIEPPGLSISPSSVTILTEWLCLLAIASALSILSTTSILPSRYLASS